MVVNRGLVSRRVARRRRNLTTRIGARQFPNSPPAKGKSADCNAKKPAAIEVGDELVLLVSVVRLDADQMTVEETSPISAAADQAGELRMKERDCAYTKGFALANHGPAQPRPIPDNSGFEIVCVSQPPNRTTLLAGCTSGPPRCGWFSPAMSGLDTAPNVEVSRNCRLEDGSQAERSNYYRM